MPNRANGANEANRPGILGESIYNLDFFMRKFPFWELPHIFWCFGIGGFREWGDITKGFLTEALRY